jgi:hypothetical protein
MLHLPQRAAVGSSFRTERLAERLPGRRSSAEVVRCAGTYRGSPAILALTEDTLFFGWVLGGGESRTRDFPIRQVMLVEEQDEGNSTELTLLLTNHTIVLADVPRVKAWAFCRHVRQAILDAAPGANPKSQIPNPNETPNPKSQPTPKIPTLKRTPEPR